MKGSLFLVRGWIVLLLEIKEVKLYKEEQNKTIYAVLTKKVNRRWHYEECDWRFFYKTKKK